MTVLAIDTSTARGSVALWENGAIALEQNFHADRSHSSTLFPILSEVRSRITRLDRIAIGLGPGSYAGVRIAIAAAMGLSLALGASLCGLASVAALASGSYLAIGDARRGMFYFTHVEDGLCMDGPRLLDATALDEAITRAPGGLPILVPAHIAAIPQGIPAAPSAARLASLAVQERGILAAEHLEPLYLREPYITEPRATLLTPLPCPPR